MAAEDVEKKQYQPMSIPKREELASASPAVVNKEVISFDENPFAEIRVEDPKHIEGKYAELPKSQELPAQPLVDNVRLMFYSMRRIGRDNSSYYHIDEAKIFYKQAEYMADFTDDYENEAAFSNYYPYYQMMGYEQLRTYFTWRTRVRNGDIRPTSLSYVFLYLYELINNIGVESPQDGLDKLMAFWHSYREFDDYLDRYVKEWIKDYHVYYDITKPFGEFVREQELSEFYPAQLAYSVEDEDAFLLYDGISKYKITQSRFYNDDTKSMIEECFLHLLKDLRGVFAKRRKSFEDCIFTVKKHSLRWNPFKRALFYSAGKKEDRTVKISPREIYTHKNRVWSYRSVTLESKGRNLTGYILKEMESQLRQKEKYPRSLAVNIHSFKDIDILPFTSAGIILPDFIKNSVEEFYKKYKWRNVKVDTGNLIRIRKEAFVTQEKLIVEEDEHISPVNEEKAPENAMSESEAFQAGDPWQELFNVFSDTEKKAISIIAEKGNIFLFSKENGILPEVLVDSINDKATDYIGDAIIEMDSEASIYEEYHNKIIEMVKH